jgi:hypothetical protein
MFRRRGLLIVALLFVLSALTSLANADSHARIVRLSYVEGDVQLTHQGSGAENATLNVPIVEGDQLRAGSNARVEVQFEDGSTIRLAPETAITFSELRLLSSGGAATAVDLDQGEAEFKITRHDEGEFQITARQRTITLKHSGRFRVSTMNSDPLQVVVWKGEVGIQNRDAGQEVAVKKNETFAQDLLDPGRYDLEKTVEADDLDQWSKQRDGYLSSYASNTAGSPYQYGVSDLNYYGQYYNVPGYGNMWQPYGVNLGWDPFSNGYWTLSPSFGYVWVSAYPWGWMPYRYGQWRFVNGYGWLWQPGSWSTWSFCPPVINAPPGFRAPTPPPIGTVVVKGGGGGSTSGGNGGPPNPAIIGNGGTRPPIRTDGPGGSRTLHQNETSPVLGVLERSGGNQGNGGKQGTDHPAGASGNSTVTGPHGAQVIVNDYIRPGTPEGGITVHAQPPETQQHTPPQSLHQMPPAPSVHPQSQPPVVTPPATVVRPSVTMSPPTQRQYTPPPAPAPVIHSAPPSMAPPMVHSAPAPASTQPGNGRPH